MEVTNAQFAAFVDDTGYVTTAELDGAGWVFVDDFDQDLIEGTNWRHPQGPDTDLTGLDEHPVVQTSWDDAVAYCNWRDARLPTEAEWERAARGEDQRIYPWGDVFDADHLNFCDVNCTLRWRQENWDDGITYTAPVGSYPSGASPYGALDMAGNVWEWVADGYNEDYYERSPDSNPEGASSGDDRVGRGGSLGNDEWGVRASFRLPVNQLSDRTEDSGFRCASTSVFAEVETTP